MKIGIISDSHDNRTNVESAARVFAEYGVKFVLHAGDMVSTFTAVRLSQVDHAKFICVLGNCDHNEAFEGFHGYGRRVEVHTGIYSGSIEGRKIYMTHSPISLERIVDSGQYDLVVYGHTHKQDIRRVGHTLIVNPGEARSWIRGNSHVVICELDDMSYETVEI